MKNWLYIARKLSQKDKEKKKKYDLTKIRIRQILYKTLIKENKKPYDILKKKFKKWLKKTRLLKEKIKKK